MSHNEAVEALNKCYRVEYRRLVGILVGIFGTHNIEMVEDIIQEAFMEALDKWEKHGVPKNSSGWLFKVAKNKALNLLKREKYEQQYVSFKNRYGQGFELADVEFTNEEIQDEQLKMMFVCCHHSLSPKAQMALILKTLCGFSIEEITAAFLSKKETITKRLARARVVIRKTNFSLALPDIDVLTNHLDTVLKTIYLLYNEGYSASKGSSLIKKELCTEAMHLANILANSRVGNIPKTHALLSLMYFNFSRFDTRQDELGHIILMEDQDREKWDKQALALGYYHLSNAVQDDDLSTYHLQASIAACHASASSFEATNWTKIVGLYDLLFQLDQSPVILLNRAVALSHIAGPHEALCLLEDDEINAQLDFYYLFHVTKADLYMKADQKEVAIDLLKHALSLTKIDTEKKFIQNRLDVIQKK